METTEVSLRSELLTHKLGGLDGDVRTLSIRASGQEVLHIKRRSLVAVNKIIGAPKTTVEA